jgi:hypothetical protein
MPLLQTFANAASRGFGAFLPSSAAAGAFEQIATVFGTGASSVITFSSIPQTYKTLQIRAVSQGNSTSNPSSMLLRFNGDSGTNYMNHFISANNGSVSASNSLSTSSINMLNTRGDETTSYHPGVIDITDYSVTTKTKTVRAIFGFFYSGGRQVNYNSGLWTNTGAITSITLTTSQSDSITTPSRFTLYGIKG